MIVLVVCDDSMTYVDSRTDCVIRAELHANNDETEEVNSSSEILLASLRTVTLPMIALGSLT